MHDKFVSRLATVYRTKHKDFGYTVAREWFEEFVPTEDRKAVIDRINQQLMEARKK